MSEIVTDYLNVFFSGFFRELVAAAGLTALSSLPMKVRGVL